MKIQAKSNKVPDYVFEGEIELGNSLEEAVQKWGAETVFKRFLQRAIVVCQEVVRQGIVAGKRGDDLQSILSGVSLAVKGEVTGRDTTDRTILKLAKAVKDGKISKEDMVAKLKAQLAAMENPQQ